MQIPLQPPDIAPATGPAAGSQPDPDSVPGTGPATGHGDGPDRRRGSGQRRAATWIAAFGAAIIAGSALFAGGFMLGRQTVLTDGTPQRLAADLQPFWDAFDSIELRYAGLPVDRHAIVEGAIDGMFRALGDPFSSYMTGEAYRASLTSLVGQFEGIGAFITTRNAAGAEGCTPVGASCHVVVTGTVPGSPAERVGLRSGDAILAVDGRSLMGRTIDQVVGLVRGPRGTQVTLRIARGAGAPFELHVTRAIITQVDVTSHRLANGTIGYIRIASFGSGAAADFTAQLHALLADGVRGIVLDLRENPGGFVDQARTIASQFIGNGPIYWEQLADGSRRPFSAEPGGIATDRGLPVAVLVDKGTASASEILAGALQDTGRATLIGTTTFGKGTVQEWQLLGRDMGGFRLTVARWLTPSQRWINGHGLTPNVVVEPSPNAPPGSDPALDRAVQWLNDQSVTGHRSTGRLSSPAAAATMRANERR